MENNFFRNKWILKLYNNTVERSYYEQIKSNLLKYVKFVILIPLLLNIIEFGLFSYLINHDQIN